MPPTLSEYAQAHPGQRYGKFGQWQRAHPEAWAEAQTGLTAGHPPALVYRWLKACHGLDVTYSYFHGIVTGRR